MDLTSIYKSRLEFIKNRNKALGSDVPENLTKKLDAKPKIFPGKKTPYYSKARELCATITSLRDFLVEHRSAYLNFGSGPRHSTGHSPNDTSVWKSNEPSFSDVDRDKIDSDVQKIIQNCQKKIWEYQQLIETSDMENSCPQLHTHLENVHNSLANYLKDVCIIHSEMRAVRVKRTVDYQTMSRLTSHTQRSKNLQTFDDKFTKPIVSSIKSTISLGNEDSMEPTEGSSSSVPAYFDDDLSPEELQILEAENAQLLNELNTLYDEADQIQTSVVQIAQLQEIFTDKVINQAKEVDKVAETVIVATENIRGGNEQIRQAIQKNADFRAWILFFIIVMSFSLLFLDWYND